MRLLKARRGTRAKGSARLKFQNQKSGNEKLALGIAQQLIEVHG
jgi:hypothetical protein